VVVGWDLRWGWWVGGEGDCGSGGGWGVRVGSDRVCFSFLGGGWLSSILRLGLDQRFGVDLSNIGRALLSF